MYETSCQSRFDALYWMLGAGAQGRPRGMEWGGRREEGSGWGMHVYLWWIHFNIWQNKYNYVKFKNKIKLKKIKIKVQQSPCYVLVAWSCPTLCGSMDCSPPSSLVHGILQARILEWIPIPLCRRSPQPRITLQKSEQIEV